MQQNPQNPQSVADAPPVTRGLTRRERLERKMTRRQEWAEKAEARSARHWAAADPSEEKTGIPFGQPILVGHHSERRHRRALDRLARHAEKAFEEADKAKHHAAKAGGLADQLDRSIFSDDANVVEALNDKRTDLERRRDHMKAANAYYKTHKTLDGWDGPSDIREDGESVLRHQAYYGKPFPPYAFTNLGAKIRTAAKRAAAIPKQQAVKAERQAKAAENGGVWIEYTRDGSFCSITFPDRPDRAILNDLRAAFFSWNGAYASWSGPTERVPDSVRQISAPVSALAP